MRFFALRYVMGSRIINKKGMFPGGFASIAKPFFFILYSSKAFLWNEKNVRQGRNSRKVVFFGKTEHILFHDEKQKINRKTETGKKKRNHRGILKAPKRFHAGGFYCHSDREQGRFCGKL